MAHHLLLADDSVTIQRVVKLTFADEDVEVVTVGDGNQAVASIDQRPPDIVLADVAMPGRSGYEVAQHIRTSPRLAHIPVLLLTGAFEPVDEARASEVGCDGVLAKPFEPDVVVSRVKELLARPRSAAPSATAAAASPATPATVVQMPKPAAPAAPFPLVAPAAAQTADTVAVVTPAPPLVFPVKDTAPVMPTVTPVVDPAAVPVLPVSPVAPVLPVAPAASVAAPAAVAKPVSAADAYFERLDQAFANLALSPRTPPAAAAEEAHVAAPALAWVTSAPAAPTATALPPTASVAAQGLTDAQIDQIVDRVIQQLTVRLGVNLADVVSSVAERVVRAEIDQIKKRV